MEVIRVSRLLLRQTYGMTPMQEAGPAARADSGTVSCHKVVRFRDDEPIELFVAREGIPVARPVLVLIGSAGNMTPEEEDVLDVVVRRALVPVLDEYRACVVDGGTDTGLARLVGRANAAIASRATLVGVAPAQMITGHPPGSDQQAPAETNHHWLVLTDGSKWTDELPLLGNLAERLAGAGTPTVLVAGGGDGTRSEVELANRLHWPIVVLGGTGREADLLVARQPSLGDAPIRIVPVDDVSAIRKELRWRLDPDDLLRRLWLALARFDERAQEAQPRRGGWRTTILILGLLVVVLALVAGLYGSELPSTLERSIVVTLAVLPVVAAVLMAWTLRRGRDRSWLALRAATNAIAREIYRYRARSGRYGGPEAEWESGEPARLLAGVWSSAITHLGRAAPIPAWSKDVPDFAPDLAPELVDRADELLGLLTGDQYCKVRINHQLGYFAGKVRRDERRISVAVAGIYFAAVAGTLMASLPWTVAWVAVASSVATAMAAWLEFDQCEQRARAMNETIAALESGLVRWIQMACDVRERREHVADLVAECEDALEDENREWQRAIEEAHRRFASNR